MIHRAIGNVKVPGHGLAGLIKAGRQAAQVATRGTWSDADGMRVSQIDIGKYDCAAVAEGRGVFARGAIGDLGDAASANRRADGRRVVRTRNRDGDVMGCAIGALDRKDLVLGLARRQILHGGVRYLVVPVAAGVYAQTAQRTAGRSHARRKDRFAGIGIGHGQRTVGGQHVGHADGQSRGVCVDAIGYGIGCYRHGTRITGVRRKAVTAIGIDDQCADTADCCRIAGAIGCGVAIQNEGGDNRRATGPTQHIAAERCICVGADGFAGIVDAGGRGHRNGQRGSVGGSAVRYRVGSHRYGADIAGLWGKCVAAVGIDDQLAYTADRRRIAGVIGGGVAIQDEGSDHRRIAGPVHHIAQHVAADRRVCIGADDFGNVVEVFSHGTRIDTANHRRVVGAQDVHRNGAGGAVGTGHRHLVSVGGAADELVVRGIGGVGPYAVGVDREGAVAVAAGDVGERREGDCAVDVGDGQRATGGEDCVSLRQILHRRGDHCSVVAAVDGDGQRCAAGVSSGVGHCVGEGIGQRVARIQRLHRGVGVVHGVGVGAVAVQHDAAVAAGLGHAQRAAADRGNGLGVAAIDVGVVAQDVARWVGPRRGVAHAAGFNRRGSVGHRHRRMIHIGYGSCNTACSSVYCERLKVSSGGTDNGDRKVLGTLNCKIINRSDVEISCGATCQNGDARDPCVIRAVTRSSAVSEVNSYVGCRIVAECNRVTGCRGAFGYGRWST